MRVLSAIMLLLYAWTAILPAQLHREAEKLPGLWQHYQEHKAIEPGHSFWDFWQQHYSEAFEAHRDAHDHSDLPGKDDQQEHVCCIHPVVMPPAIPMIGMPHSAHATQRINFSYRSPRTHNHARNIWQPPKA